MSPQHPADPALAPAVDDIHAQHARIVARLKAHGCTSCADLTAACDVPSVTRIVCDLTAAGWPVARMFGVVRTQWGARRRATFYELAGAHAQGDQFGNPAR